METIKTEQSNLHYLSRAEFQAIIMVSKLKPNTQEYSWSDKFKEGDIIHISEMHGRNSTLTVRRKLIIEPI